MNYNTFYSMTSPGRKSKNQDHQEQSSLLSEVLKQNQELVSQNTSLRDEISVLKTKVFELQTKNGELSIGDARDLVGAIKQFKEKEHAFEQKFVEFRQNAEREHKNQYDDITKTIEKQHSQKYIAEIDKLKKKNNELSSKNMQYMQQKLKWDENYISKVSLDQAKSQIDSLTKEKAILSEKLLQAEKGFRSQKEQKHEKFKDNIEDRLNKFQQKVQEKQNERQSFERQNNSKLKGVSSQLKNMLKTMLKLKNLEKTINSAKFKGGLEYLSRTASQSSKDELPSFDGKRFEQQFQAMVEQINQKMSSDQEQLRRIPKLLEAEKQKGIQTKEKSDKQLADKNKKLQELENEVRDKKAAIDRSNEVLKQKGRQIEQKGRQIEQKDQQIQQMSTSLKNLKSSLDDKQRKNSSLASQSERQKREFQRQKDEAKRTIGQLTSQKQKLEKKISEQQQKHNQLLAKLNDSEMQAENQISRLKKEIEKKVSEIQRLNKIKKDLERTIAERDTTIKLKTQDIDNLKKQNLKLSTQLKDTRSSLQRKQSQNLDLTTDLKKKSKDLTSAKTDLNQAYEELRDLRITEQAFRQVNGKLLPELSFYMGKEKIQFDHEEPDSSLTSTLSWFKSRYNQAKFFGDSEVIPRDKVDFLLKEIKTFTNNNVVESKLLYKYDTRNTLNFHNFVDQKENMLIVIRLINNITVGGFSCYPLSKLDKEQAKKQGVGRGFLFNLTFDKSFQMRKDAKNLVMTYDEFFFLFGNSELRLRSQEKKFFSNFGVANSTFDNAGFPRSQFLGVHDPACNQLEIVGYEFYQVKFKQ